LAITTINQWRYYQMLECQTSRHKRKVSFIENVLVTVLPAIWGNRLETVSHELQVAAKKPRGQCKDKDGKLTVLGNKWDAFE